MPTYVYTDSTHDLTTAHGMNDNPLITCPVCGEKMHRKPQAPRVNWGGLPPHADTGRSPSIQGMIDNADQRREQFEATKDSNPFNEFSKRG